MELDMTKGSPAKLIASFLIPTVIGNVFQQLYNMVDTIIVGQYLGNQALAAVGATGTIMFLILGFMTGLTAGFTVLTSQRFGAGDMDAMKKSVGMAALLSVAATVIMTTVSVAGMDGLLRLMQTPEDIFLMSKSYILIICGGMWCTVLYNLLASVLRAVGNSRVPLYFLILAACTNIALDLLFIIQFGMGVEGAAWATVVSQGLSGILCLIYMAFKVPVLKLSREHYRPDSHVMLIEMKIGIPMALQFSITAVGTILVQAVLNTFGSTIVAAYTAATKVEQLVTQPYAAMGMTMATYSGQNCGIGDYDRIRQGAKTALVMSTIYSVIIFIVIMVLQPYLIKLFVSENFEQINSYARIYLFVCGLCFTFLGMIFIYRNVLQGCGYALMPTMGGVVELVCRAVMAAVAAGFSSYAGVCSANGITWLITGVFLWIAYVIIFRKLPRGETAQRSDR